MVKKKKIRIGISVGDLNGIGGELIIRTFEDSRILEFCTPIVFASIKIFDFLKKHFDSKIILNGISHPDQAHAAKVNIVDIKQQVVSINFGNEDFNVGAYAVHSLRAATAALKRNQVDVLLTAPLNKHTIQSDAFQFPGHTDFLEQELEGDSLMFMVSESLRVGLLTDHVPVKEVCNYLSSELIHQKIETIYHSLKNDFAIRAPKIAVLGINPHVGDNGVIGLEDDTILKPALEDIRSTGKLVFGPYAADSFFGSNNYKSFDAIVATYHDQGLIPFKTIAFGKGVNFTAGLDKVRTSPDHGTAFEIAGKGIADCSSFKEALFVGMTIFKNRQLQAQLSANPLKKQPKKRPIKK